MSVYQTFQQGRNHIAFSAPHFSAAQAGITLLEQGATAIEATIASAASLGVLYPHMTGLGGDGFWLISEPGKPPLAIDASGTSAKAADPSIFEGHTHIPSRGGLSAITMAGAVSGWQKALEINKRWNGKLPLNCLFSHAIGQARWGFEVTTGLANACEKVLSATGSDSSPHLLLTSERSLSKGDVLKLPRIADTLEHLANNGLNEFYSGEVSHALYKSLENSSSPIQHGDFTGYSAKTDDAISVYISKGKIFNIGAPTQGVSTLLILAICDKLMDEIHTEADLIHVIVEATKQALEIRNRYVCDPAFSTTDVKQFLSKKYIDQLAQKIDLKKALPWQYDDKPGDTVWTGCIDNQGRMVSYIQSLYWEFGSTVECPQTGVIWNNRGHSFSLLNHSPNVLAPEKKPLHTLNPSYAELSNGSRLCFGAMGGDGQPQFQAAIFIRYIYQALSQQNAISKGRWLLGRNWGTAHSGLLIESDIALEIRQDLSSRGHDISLVDACSELMGHAGMVELKQTTQTVASSDPRSDGRAFSSLGIL